MSDWHKDFPMTDKYRNAEGKQIEFKVTAQELPTCFHVTAIETEKSRGKRIGYHFVVFSNLSPYEALGKIRLKIRETLSIKYIDDSGDEPTLTHDKLVGRVTYSRQEDQVVIEVDGKEINSDQFWKILSMYEGFEISLVIKEQ
jgi:hypothetical protein